MPGSVTTEAVDPEHPAHDYYPRWFAHIERDVSVEIAALQAIARIRAELNPRETANLLIFVSDGLTERWLIDPSVDMDTEFAAAVDRFSGP